MCKIQVLFASRHTYRRESCLRAGTISREVLSSGDRKKYDEETDSQFYSFPRLVKHVDESFLAAVTQLYRELIPADGEVLDLMSSWVSHLPSDRKYKRVVGHGMNAVELQKNSQLDSFFVRDLNREPEGWAAADASFDAVTCCVSVQYLQQPEKVFSEIYRVLKPQGVCIITFSNRLYSTKAIKAWRDMGNDYGRIQLVKQYFLCIDGFTQPEALREIPKKVLERGLAGLVTKARNLFQQVQQDPFYAVVAYKDSKPSKA